MAASQFGEQAATNTLITFNLGSGVGPLDADQGFGGPLSADAIYLSNSDVIDYVIDIGYKQFGNVAWLGSVTVPAGSGFGGTPAVEAFTTILGTQLGQLRINVGDQLTLQLETAIVSGASVTALVVQGTV